MPAPMSFTDRIREFSAEELQRRREANAELLRAGEPNAIPDAAFDGESFQEAWHASIWLELALRSIFPDDDGWMKPWREIMDAWYHRLDGSDPWQTMRGAMREFLRRRQWRWN